jgi:hypothetical protein
VAARGTQGNSQVMGVEVQACVASWNRPLLSLVSSVIVASLLSGCLSDGAPSSAVVNSRSGNTVSISGNDPNNSAPRIQGTPPKNVVAGQQYLFKPKANDADGDPLIFSVQNLPSWASFDSATGRISGKPTAADVGSYKEIVVAVSDGAAQAQLPEFAVAVVQMGPASVTLSWAPPTENTDGSPLQNLSGYKIHYGNASGDYSTTVPVSNPGITRYVIEGLGSGTYFFAITALSANGAESDFSAEVSTTIS